MHPVFSYSVRVPAEVMMADVMTSWQNCTNDACLYRYCTRKHNTDVVLRSHSQRLSCLPDSLRIFTLAEYEKITPLGNTDPGPEKGN